MLSGLVAENIAQENVTTWIGQREWLVRIKLQLHRNVETAKLRQTFPLVGLRMEGVNSAQRLVLMTSEKINRTEERGYQILRYEGREIPNGGVG